MPEYRILFMSTWRAGRERTLKREIRVESDAEALEEFQRMAAEAKRKDALGEFFEMPYEIHRIEVREKLVNLTPKASP